MMASGSATEIFSFGYYGWGTSTEQLVKSVDSVEKSRGFLPPVFVDVRLRRQGRATGFIGSAFEQLLGPKRHRWMKSLGNLRVVSKSGARIQIAEPESAAELLDLALEASEMNRRVIFFCSCLWPRYCHRAKVARLVMAEAKKQKQRIAIQEWPGDKPQRLELDVDSETFLKVLKGGRSIPVGRKLPLATIAGLPQFSIATIHLKDDRIHRLVGPAQWIRGTWALPILWPEYGDDPTVAECRVESSKSFKQLGYGLVSG